MNQSTLAIDVGLSGGIAYEHLGAVHSDAMHSTEGDILEHLTQLKRQCDTEGAELIAYVELVPTGMPNRGAAMVKLNANAAFIRGCLMALKIRMILVRPVEWQSFYNLGKRAACKSDVEWKNKLKAEAQRRFPNEKVTLKTADALLILDWAKRQGNLQA